MYFQLKPTMLHLVCLLLLVLHMGSKWKSSVKNSKVIDIILLSDELLRTVEILTRGSSFIRPIHKLCLLECI